MPGSEAAGVTPPPLTADTPAAPPAHNVIDFRRRALARNPRRQDAPTMDDATPEVPDPATERLAIHVQATFADQGRTLTDPATAEVYGITMNLVASIVDAAHARGHIDEAGHDHLHGLVSRARRAPDCL